MAKYASCIFGFAASVYILRIVTRARDAPRRKGRRRAEGQSLCRIFYKGVIFNQNRIPHEQGA